MQVFFLLRLKSRLFGKYKKHGNDILAIRSNFLFTLSIVLANLERVNVIIVTGEKDANNLFAPTEDRTRVSCVLIQHSIASL